MEDKVKFSSEKTPLIVKEENEQTSDSDKSDAIKEDKKLPLKFSNISRRSKIILILCTVAQLLTSVAFSLLGPFYPLEAEKKGMSLTLTGFVLGVFELLIFLLSPVYGKFLTRIGPKFCYVVGFLVGGVCNILFGTLDKAPNGTPFIALSIACRSVEAFGFSAFVTASFAIISTEFPDDIGFVFGILELGTGIGFMVGPAIGGALYSLGGYGLPFYTIGLLVLLNGVFMFVFLPTPEAVIAKRRTSMFNLFRSPMVVVPMFSVLCAAIGISMFSATLAKHMEPLGLSTSIVSLFFTIVAVLYSVMSTVWGYITDKKNIQAPLIIFGHLVFGIGYLFIGPSPLLNFIPFEIWSLALGLCLMGFSFGCCVIPTMKCMLLGACELGYENNMDTNAMVSGLFNAASCLGSFVGPVGGGALIEKWGYQWTYTGVSVCHFVAMLLSVLFFSIRRYRKTRESSLHPDNIESTNDGGLVVDEDLEIETSHTQRSYPRTLSVSSG